MIFWLLGVAVLCLAFALKIKLTGIVFVSSFAVPSPSLSPENGRPQPPRAQGRPGEHELLQWRTDVRTDTPTQQQLAPLPDLRA
jgi:hypothetical protein